MTTPADSALDPIERTALQRRTLRVLRSGQVVGAATVTMGTALTTGTIRAGAAST